MGDIRGDFGVILLVTAFHHNDQECIGYNILRYEAVWKTFISLPKWNISGRPDLGQRVASVKLWCMLL